MPKQTESVLLEVAVERLRQDRRFGEQKHVLPMWNTILMEEVGEVSRAIYEAHHAVPDFRQPHLDNLRDELVQVAAVAVAMVEYLDRNKDWKLQ